MIRSALILGLLASPLAAQDLQILPGYSDFRKPEAGRYVALTDLLPTWALSFPESTEGSPRVDLMSTVVGERLVVEVTSIGGGDDSVSAIQIRYELEQDGTGAWVLMAYGFRQQCARSGSEGWTSQPCP